jgi:hypothetical protein
MAYRLPESRGGRVKSRLFRTISCQIRSRRRSMRLKIGRSMQVAFGARPGLQNPLPLENRSKRQSLGSDQIHRAFPLNGWNAGNKRTGRKINGWRERKTMRRRSPRLQTVLGVDTLASCESALQGGSSYGIYLGLKPQAQSFNLFGITIGPEIADY